MSILEAVQVCSNLLGAVFGVIAGWYWLKGARAFVVVSEEPDAGGMLPFTISERDSRGRNIDVLETAAKQAGFNGTAARWGAATAVLLALGQFASLFQ